MSDQQRTLTQNNSLQLWCRQSGVVLKASSLTYLAVVEAMAEYGVDTQWDEHVFKHLFRSILHKVYGHESTALAQTDQYDTIYQAMCRFFGEREVVLPPWPDRFGQMEAGQKIYGRGDAA